MPPLSFSAPGDVISLSCGLTPFSCASRACIRCFLLCPAMIQNETQFSVVIYDLRYRLWASTFRIRFRSAASSVMSGATRSLSLRFPAISTQAYVFLCRPKSKQVMRGGYQHEDDSSMQVNFKGVRTWHHSSFSFQ